MSSNPGIAGWTVNEAILNIGGQKKGSQMEHITNNNKD